MSSGQQIIKVLAIIFAIFLIVNIFGWALFGVSTLIGIDMLGQTVKEERQNSKTMEFSKTYDAYITQIKVETTISKLTIKSGANLKVEGYNLPTKFSSKTSGNTLIVKEEGNQKTYKNKVNSELIITVPEGKTLEYLKIETGIGNDIIQDISAKSLELNCGVGVMQINNVTVLSKTKIEGGAGKIEVQNSNFQNLDLESGIGQITIEADVTGKSNITGGVGKLDLKLLQNQEAYSITTKTGIGKMTIDEKTCKDNNVYGSGSNTIKIEGGVGVITVTTNKYNSKN